MHPSAAGEGEEDRISAVPDEILHEILARLRSPKQAAQSAVLSKRWAGAWQSYPILEFDGMREFESASKRFSGCRSRLPAMEALRMSVSDPRIDLVDSMWILAAQFRPKEISIHIVKNKRQSDDASLWSLISYIMFPTLLHPTLTNSLFRGLEVLRLRGFSFDSWFCEYSVGKLFAGRSLKVLCLEDSAISCEKSVLNWMMEGAPLLERLTLTSVEGIQKLEIGGHHPKLKFIRVESSKVESFEITGAPSLEIVSLFDCRVRGGLRVSSAPNVRVVRSTTSPPINRLDYLPFVACCCCFYLFLFVSFLFS